MTKQSGDIRNDMSTPEKPSQETRGGEGIDWARTEPGKPLQGKQQPVTEAPDDYILDHTKDPNLRQVPMRQVEEISELDT